MTLDEKVQKYIKENPQNTCTISFRVTKEENEKIRAIAKKYKVPMSTIVKIATLDLLK